MRIGYCFTGSFCTLEESYRALEVLVNRGEEIVPIMSENVYYTDTRFTLSEEFSTRVERLCNRRIIHTITDAEPLGPSEPLDLLIVAPCTGNTMAKVANGITDTAATMAIKAHLRCDRPTLLGVCSNDAMSQNLKNLAYFLTRGGVYLVPMKQDSPKNKPHSLVCDFSLIPDCIEAIKEKRQLRPLFL